jgi:hypothetical protein
MAKTKRGDVAARGEWIQERLGERKYRQLRMHLSSALRLLSELATASENHASNGSREVETTEAMTALTERLRALVSASRCHLDSRSPTRERATQTAHSAPVNYVSRTSSCGTFDFARVAPSLEEFVSRLHLRIVRGFYRLIDVARLHHGSLNER